MRRIHPCTLGARPVGTRLIVISLLVLSGALSARTARAVPLTVYGALPSIENVAVSPDGSRVAYVRTDGDARIVFIATVADRKMIRYVRIAEDKLRSVEWADDDNVMITTSITSGEFRGFRDEWFMLRVYNVTQNDVRELPGKVLSFDNNNRVINTVVGRVMVRHIDGHTVLFVPGIYLTQGVALFRCDLTTRTQSMVRVGSEEASRTSWLVDSQGKLAAEEEYVQQGQRWSIKVFPGGNPGTTVSGRAALDPPEVLGFGPTTDTLLVESRENGARLWQLLSVNDGKFAVRTSWTGRSTCSSIQRQKAAGRRSSKRSMGTTFSTFRHRPTIQRSWCS
jgi:hypothetical protein